MKDAVNLLLHLFPIGEESIHFFAVKYNTKKETSMLICTVMKSCVGHNRSIHCSEVRERGRMEEASTAQESGREVGWGSLFQTTISSSLAATSVNASSAVEQAYSL